MRKNEHQNQKSSSIDSESADNSTSEDESQTLEINSSSISTNYEKQREETIAANKARIEALGLKNIAKSLMNIANSTSKSKRVGKKKKKNDDYDDDDDDDDDEYEPDCGGDDDDDDQMSSSGDDEDYEEEEEETFVRRNRKSSPKKVKNMKLKSDKQVPASNLANVASFMDEDEALKQAIALSLKDVGDTSDLQHAGSSQKSNLRTASSKEKSCNKTREDNTKTRKRKLFNSRVQMTEDDLIIHFCQIDEVGKGVISLRDVERMAAAHDFTWTDKELSDMIHCFDSDRDGKLTLDDFRNIVQRCNMLQAQEDF